MLSQWLYVSLLFIFQAQSKKQPCNGQDLLHARNLYDIFNTGKKLSPYNPVTEAEDCQLIDFTLDGSSYIAYRYQVSRDSDGVIYLVYDDSPAFKIDDDEDEVQYRSLRLLQPWERPYRYIIEKNKDQDDDVLNIHDRWTMYSNLAFQGTMRMLGSWDSPAPMTEVQYFGNYADHWTVLRSGSYMKVSLLLQAHDFVFNAVEDLPVIKCQKLPRTVYHVQNDKGSIMFALATGLNAAKASDVVLLKLTGLYKKIRLKEVSALVQFSII